MILVASFALLAALPAAADDADVALALAEQGEAAAAGGDLPGAVGLFKRALALDPRPEYQCNVGVAYYKAGDLPRAQLFLSLCLARGSHLDATFLGGVRGVLVAVEDTMRAGAFTPIDVVVTPASAQFTISAFADDEIVVGSRLVWLPEGEHRVTVSHSGHEAQTVAVTAAGHDPVRVPVVLSEVVEIEPPPPPVRGPEVVVDRRAGWRTAAWTGTAVTVVIAALTGVQYVRATDAADAAGLLPSGVERDAAVRDADRQTTLLYAGYGVTAACALITGVLWWQSMPRQRQVMVTADGDGAAVWLGGTF